MKGALKAWDEIAAEELAAKGICLPEALPSSLSGTGSNPPFVNGRQRPSLFIASTMPRRAPCREIASCAYFEHDG
ncbi:MAG TPA: hypothetical protein VN884_11910 [Candidatus Sulfotelmatobacter sp.]|nr:hypothetical protein [Candidatus Sulfotelmatobacter sp.]